MELKKFEEEKQRLANEHTEVKRICVIINDLKTRIEQTNNQRPLAIAAEYADSLLPTDKVYLQTISDLAKLLIQEASALLEDQQVDSSNQDKGSVKIDL